MLLIGKKIYGVFIFVAMCGVVGTIIVRFAKYASYCGLFFMDKRHTTKSMKIYTTQKFLHVW